MWHKQYWPGLYAVLIALPFVLLTDFFPFVRFGMFAEPASRQAKSREYFVILYQDSHKKWQNFDTRPMGFDAVNFSYLLRNYYYQDQMATFAEKWRESRTLQQADTLQVAAWQVWQLQVEGAQRDSTLVYTFTHALP